MTRGERLAELRGTRTQKQIADAVGVTPQAVSNWERGVADVDQRLLAALDVALDAGGEVVSLYAHTASGLTLTAIDAKLDDLSAQVTAEVGSNTALAVELMRQMVENQRQMLAGLGELLAGQGEIRDRLPSRPSRQRSGGGARPAPSTFD